MGLEFISMEPWTAFWLKRRAPDQRFANLKKNLAATSKFLAPEG